MGLDMYLRTADKDLAERMYYLNVKHDRVEESNFEYDMAMKGYICYWRKQSSIHNFFVQEAQNGEDDCGTYEVDFDSLKLLYERIKEVIITGDDSKLPVIHGFFFNPPDYEEWVREGLLYTYGFLRDLFDETIEVDGRIYYKKNYVEGTSNWDARIEYRSSW